MMNLPRLSEQDEAEIEKCRQSEAYFYNKYLKPPDMDPLTDEQIKRFRKIIESQRETQKRNPQSEGSFLLEYPLTIDELTRNP